ncbi:MAG: DUF2397 family protein, partial [Desulfitobacterium sp.]|nr:DUF2397 family protein [Desulfitobacterium sp.]
SACVFGVAHTRHLYVEDSKETESLNREIWEEPAGMVNIRPKVRNFREKTRPNAVLDQTARKKATMEAYLAEKAREQELMDELVKGNRIVLRDLKEVNPFVRKTLLTWIAKSMTHPERKGKTENGMLFQLQKMSDKNILLRAEDGDLVMPDFCLVFEEMMEAAR